MPRKIRRSIAWRVIVTMVGLVTLVLAIVGGVSYQAYSRQQWAALRSDFSVTADQISAGITLAVWNFDGNQIQKIMGSALHDQAIVRIVVHAGDKQYALSRDGEFGIDTTPDDKVADADMTDLIMEMREIRFNEQQIGHMQLYLSPRFLQHQLRQTKYIMIGVIVLLDVVLILSLYALIWQRVLRPLKLIERFATSISSGRKAEAIAITQPLVGEFGQLRNSLDKMVTLLESRLEDLTESNDRFWGLVHGLPVSLGIYSPVSGRITFINNKFIDTFGYQPEDVPDADTWFRLAYPDETYRRQVQAQWHVDLDDAHKHQNVVAIREYVVTTKFGAEKIIEIGGVLAGGYVMVMFNDTTERRQAEEALKNYKDDLEELVRQRTFQLEENERLLREAQAIAHLGYWHKDIATQYISWQDETYKIYGVTPGEEITPEMIRGFVHPDDRNGFEKALEKLYTQGERFSTDFRIIRHDKRICWLHVEGYGIFDENSNLQRLAGTVQDITERKLNEIELLKSRQAAEAANRAKSVFLANMSHELRTPLNSVIGFSRMMAKDADLTGHQQRNLEIINRAGTHLLTLINDILELSKIDAGKMDVSAAIVDLPQLLSEVVEMLRPRAEQGGITLLLETFGIPPAVITDAAKLRQVLLNLVSNAVKFTARGGVTLLANSKQTGENAVIEFQVSDTGRGIRPEDQARIFEPFVQLDNSGERTGTGLGLAISRQYVQMMGSALQLRSTSGEGSTFSFTLKLPISSAPAAAGEAVPSNAEGDSQHSREYRVLLADDVAEMRMLLRDMLEPLGLEVLEAENGIQARELTIMHQPQLVLLDWRMPLLDGVELTKAIRAQPGIVQPRIIMLSANAFNEDRQEALSAGVDDFMGKPIDMEVLYRMIERHIGIHLQREKEKNDTTDVNLQPVSDEDLRGLSAATVQEFTDALRELNPAKIAIVMTLISAEAPQLAARLDSYVTGLQYRQLWQLFGILDDA